MFPFEEKQFQIDQLRKDKMIYAIEACAINLISILIFLFAQLKQPSLTKDFMLFGSILLALGYTSYMGLSNLRRLKLIKKLEQELLAAHSSKHEVSNSNQTQS